MKKLLVLTIVLTALLASQITLAQTSNTSTSTPPTVNQPNVACFQAAIEKRDTALIAAVEANRNAIVSALGVRKEALKSAWNLTDRKERRTAINAAWNNWRKSMRTARVEMNKAKKNAWNTFYTEREACGSIGRYDDQMGSGIDSQL